MKKKISIGIFVLLVILRAILRLDITEDYIEFLEVEEEMFIANDNYEITVERIDQVIMFELHCNGDMNIVIPFEDYPDASFTVNSCIISHGNILLNITFSYNFTFKGGDILSFDSLIGDLQNQSGQKKTLIFDYQRVNSEGMTRGVFDTEGITHTIMFSELFVPQIKEEDLISFEIGYIKVSSFARK